MKNLLIWGFKSVYGTLNLSKANLAAESAFSFPFIAMWLEIQHIRISFELDLASNFPKSLVIKGSSGLFVFIF